MFVSSLQFWSDDADTNSSSMQGRAKVWVKTFTMTTPLSDGNRLENTYPLAIGLKGVSHEEIEKRIAADLVELQSSDLKPFYIGSENKFARGYIEVMANLGDQPEKRGANHLLLGGSTYGARLFVSANHIELFPQLRACDDCLRKMSERFKEARWALPLPACQKCLNWDVLKKETDLSLAVLKDEYMYPYPGRKDKNGTALQTPPGLPDRVVQKDGKHYLTTFQITYRTLQDAINVAHQGFCEYQWDKKTCTAFLEVEGLNAKAIERFHACAERASALELALAGKVDATLRADLLTQFNSSPELFQKMPIPALWTRPGVDLATHIEGIMHLGPLGIVKKCVLHLQWSLTASNSNKSFIDANAKYVKALSKMKIDWLKVMEYSGGKFHGWVSENYLGFARIMPWFYQNYDKAIKEPQEVVQLPPVEMQPQWSKICNSYWLKIRRLKTSGNAPELSLRVAKKMKEDPLPEILPPPEIVLKDVEDVVTTLLCVMECIMATEVTEDTIAQTEYAIRLFLSAFENLDAKLRKPKDKPTVVKSYNFACLLNLPNAMRLLGPLWFMYKGKYQGEAFLTFAKSWHTQGIRTNWEVNLMKNILRERAFSNVLPPEASDERLVKRNLLWHQRSNFYKYGSSLEVKETMGELDRDKKAPLSVILAVDDKVATKARIFAVVNTYNDVIEITMPEQDADICTIEKFGLVYTKFNTLEGTEPMDWCTEVVPSLASLHIGFAVLLPLLRDGATEENRLFSMVASNWKKLTLSNTIGDLL